MDEPVLAAANLIGRWGLDEGSGTTAANTARAAQRHAGVDLAGDSAGLGLGRLRLRDGAGARERRAAVLGGGRLRHVRRGHVRRSGRRSSRSRPGSSAKPPARRSAPARAASPRCSRSSPRGAAKPRTSNVDMNYFLGINTAGASPVLAADFEEGAAGAMPGLNHPISGTTADPHGHLVSRGGDLRRHDAAVVSERRAGRSARLSSGSRRAPTAFSTRRSERRMTSAGAAAGFFAGSLDETRIWNYARSAAQMAASVNREIATADGLLARWSFNDCCGRVADSTGHLPLHRQARARADRAWSWTPRGDNTLSPAPINLAPVVLAGADQHGDVARGRDSLRLRCRPATVRPSVPCSGPDQRARRRGFGTSRRRCPRRSASRQSAPTCSRSRPATARAIGIGLR